jgi:two-component system response regulator NreC
MLQMPVERGIIGTNKGAVWMLPEERKNIAELLQELKTLRKRVAEFEHSSLNFKRDKNLEEEKQPSMFNQDVSRLFTKTEMKILSLILEGLSNKEIAHLLHRSVRTVEVHRSHIMRKFEVDNLIDLVKQAATMGLIELPESLHKNSEAQIPKTNS